MSNFHSNLLQVLICKAGALLDENFLTLEGDVRKRRTKLLRDDRIVVLVETLESLNAEVHEQGDEVIVLRFHRDVERSAAIERLNGGIGAAVAQQAHYRDEVHGRGDVQSRGASEAPRVRVRAVPDQRGAGVDVPGDRRAVQRGVAFAVVGVHIRAVVEQQHQHGGVAFERRAVESGEPVVVAPIHGRPLQQTPLQRFHIPLARRFVEELA